MKTSLIDEFLLVAIIIEFGFLLDILLVGKEQIDTREEEPVKYK